MSVQPIETYVVYDEGVLHPIGSVDPGDIGAIVVLAADHARIVNERVAEVTDALIDARREALAEMEGAHAAALAEAEQRGRDDYARETEQIVEQWRAAAERAGLADAEGKWGNAMLSAQTMAYDRGYEFAKQQAAAPRTLTADSLAELRAAVADEGPVSSYHREVMRRHRKEWPTLWKAIDHLLNRRTS